MAFTPEQRLKIVFEGMKDDISIKDLCKKYNISRKTYYDWKKDIEESALNTWENRQPGRNSDSDVSSINEAQQKIKELKQQQKSLEEKLEQSQKESALNRLERDYIKFKLTKDDIDPEIKEINKEILKKNDLPPEKNNGS